MKTTAKELGEFFKNISNYDRTLGLKLEVEDAGVISYEMVIKEEHINQPNMCHGGVIAGMMDGVLGLTALSYSATEGKLCSTVEFKVNYISEANLGETLYGTGEIDFKGKSLVVTNGKIIEKKSGRLVAKGMGTFNLYPMDKKEFPSWK